MTYRLLPREEWGRLEALFDAKGLDKKTIPSPDVAQCAVAEEDGERIVAFLFLQMVLHAEPIWIDSAERGRVKFTSLVSTVEALFSPEGQHCYYAFVNTPVVEKMARHVGMQPVPFQVFKKEVGA
ncbi:MAG TPA: hypothetical protein VIV12_31320 [Streptosporangiaceae bacterium]